MVGGSWRLRNGDVLAGDPDRQRARLQQQALRLWSST